MTAKNENGAYIDFGIESRGFSLIFGVSVELRSLFGLILRGVFAQSAVPVAQLVRASDCDSEGRRFESAQAPHFDRVQPDIGVTSNTEHIGYSISVGICH
jgi:hypothetical protein